MNSKTILSTFIALFLLVSLASGLTLSTPSDLSNSNNQTTLTLTNNNNVTQDVTLSVGSIVQGSDQVIFALSPSSVNEFNASQSKTITLSISQLINTLDFGKYTTTVSATSNISSTNATVTYVKSFCKSGETGILAITSADVTSDGDDDDVWKPLDNIEVEIDFENDGNDDLQDIFIELGIFDSSGNNVADDLKYESTDEEEIDYGDLDEGDDDTVSFNFQVPADFDTGNYKLAVKVYSDDSGESSQCADISSDFDNSFYHEVEVEAQDDEGKYIAFDNIEISPTEAVCGETVSLIADVYNIGENDEDQVKIYLRNTELNIDTSVEIKEDLDTGDDAQITLSFVVPQNAKDKTYALELSSAYDYSKGNYRESSDEDTIVPLTVLGCSPTNTNVKIASISASLGSSAKAGSPLTVNSKVTNTGSSPATFVVSGSGYESWADLTDVSERIVSLSAGESKDVIFTFDVADDASGTNSFVIEVQSGDKQETRTVSVAVEGKSGFSFQGNSMIWIIGAVNVILIILIIVVAVSISRR